MSKIINRSLFLMLFVFVTYSQFTNSVFAESLENPTAPVIVANNDHFDLDPSNVYGHKLVTDQVTAIDGQSLIFTGNDTFDGGPIPETASINIISYDEVCHPDTVGIFPINTTFHFNCGTEGEYTFHYKIIVNNVESNEATVTVYVGPSNLPPVVEDHTYTMDQGSTLDMLSDYPALVNDPNNDPLIFTITTQPQHGTLEGLNSESGAFIYTPDESYYGEDNFSFTVFDGELTSNISNVIVDIIKTNQKPKLNLVGSSTINLYFYKPYIEKGATSTDVEDGDLTSSIITTGSVDSQISGTYEITYTVTDSGPKPLTTIKKRIVNVIHAPKDIDGDGIPNTLDPDMDGDGILNSFDDDTDGDGIPNDIDTDDDADEVLDLPDDFPIGAIVSTTTLEDFDNDGLVNSLDPDMDGDGIANDLDQDIDGDGILNDIDEDDDNDGILDTEDKSPFGFVVEVKKVETPTTGSSTSSGGGGGGSSSGGGSFVIPLITTGTSANNSTTTVRVGKVLGASIDLSATSTDDTCGNYLSPDTVIGPGLKNNKNQVILLQRFLNRELNLKIPLLGFYGRATQAAVKIFQVKYRKDILDPWGIKDPTPYVYSTTVAKINSLVCPAIKDNLGDLKLIPINLSTPAN